jgi:hypothetical protein
MSQKIPMVSAAALIGLKVAMNEIVEDAHKRVDDPETEPYMKAYYSGYADAVETLQVDLQQLIDMATNCESSSDQQP